MFFFEKKNQKTFAVWRCGPGKRECHREKVFCFFSSEKKTSLFGFNIHSNRDARS
jgi:hypothetical protein